MALYSVVFLGSTPIGGPLSGWLAETYDPRVALVLAGVSGLSAAWAARVCFARLRRRRGGDVRTAELADPAVRLAASARRGGARPAANPSPPSTPSLSQPT